MKIAMIQLNYKVGDFEGNFQKIMGAIRRNQGKADVIVFTELCLSGYYPMDLLDRPGFVDTQDQYLARLCEETVDCPAVIVVGAITRNSFAGKPFFNSLLVLQQGKIDLIYNKMLLPTYNIFDEKRHFEPGRQSGVMEIKGKRVGFLVCEDGWFDKNHPEYAVDPVSLLEFQNLDVIIHINASPSNRGKLAQRTTALKHIVTRCKAPLVYVNQVGANDEVVFDGASFVMAPDGQLLYGLRSFAECEGIIQLNSMKSVSSVSGSPLMSFPTPAPDNEVFYKQTVLGVRDYMAKTGFAKAIVNCSGGIDSALTIALACAAIGPENVTAITMPSRHSSAGSIDDSVTLCENFGVKLFTSSIEEEYRLAEEEFERTFGEKPSGLTCENIQARIRGLRGMAYSNHFGALVLSTGNKSEMSVGYATLYGDMCGGLAVIGDLYKMEVFALSRYVNQSYGREMIPNAIINKEPSAELSDGQKDTDSLPPYPQLDAILRMYIEQDLLDAATYAKCLQFIQEAGPDVVTKVIRMVDKAEFKRKQAPPIIRVQRRSFGAGRQLLVSANYVDLALRDRAAGDPAI